jgi:hypothetical protein
VHRFNLCRLSRHNRRNNETLEMRGVSAAFCIAGSP